jgi:hypothetical protein
MEAIRNLLPKGVPVSVVVIGATILLSAVYSYITKQRPHPDFPLISVRGLGPRRSWMSYSSEVLQEGLKQVWLFRI